MSSKLEAFETVPDLYLIISPDLILLNASNAYLEATFTSREHLVGKHIFEAFPDNPEHVDADGVSKVRSSLEYVLKHKTPHKMAVQRYDVPRPAHLGAGFEEKFWYPIHTPVLNADKEVEYIIQKVVDITQEIQREEEYKSFVKKSAQQIEQAVSSKNQLQVEREKLYSLFMQAPAIIAVMTGPKHVFELANPGYRELVGMDRPLIGKTVREALPEIEGQGFFELLDQVYDTGIPFQGTETPVRLDAPNTGQLEPRYLDFIYQPLRNDSKEIQGILAFIVDVTEKVAARERAAALQAELLANARKLIQERETYYQVFEMTPAAICIQRGPEHRYEYFNAAYQLMFPDRELQGRSVAEALPETVTGGFVTLLDQVYQTGETYFGYEMPLTIIQPDGSKGEEIYFTFTYQAYRESGQIVGISTFAYNVTQQVHERQQAAQMAADLKLVAANAPVFIFRTDATGRITYVNDSLLEWSGLRINPNQLDQVWEMVHPDDLPEINQSFRQALQAGQPWESSIYRIRRRDGEYRWSITRTQPYFTPDQKLAGYSGVNVEIHAQIELQQQLKRTNVDLDNFIYTASHDLKAPILNIEGLMEALQDQLPAESLQAEDVQFTLNLMQNSIQRFKRTIGHLTEITKLQKENSAEATPINLPALLAEVQLDLATPIQTTQARIEIDVSNCPTIRFSTKNLRSIVYNLISNAIKYHSPARIPLIQLHCTALGEYQVLTVTDNGLGMDLSGKSKLFTMFKRLHTHVEGSGIGLYMVKKIIENAGGKIEVESTIDQGSTFRIYFRRNKEEV